MRYYAPYLKKYARRLRSDMTDAEHRFWYCVRRKRFRTVQFYRQKPIGQYIVDFYAPAAQLVVEVDGGQHFTVEGRVRDAQRDAALARMGLRILRFDDRMVLMETDAVLDEVWNAICAVVGEGA
ncbi:MAG TPA: DUF559 domain-containing protein [Luteimonas sp.]|nr:DUF559 domain-containing protein [Luteimonas sp.]